MATVAVNIITGGFKLQQTSPVRFQCPGVVFAFSGVGGGHDNRVRIPGPYDSKGNAYVAAGAGKDNRARVANRFYFPTTAFGNTAPAGGQLFPTGRS